MKRISFKEVGLKYTLNPYDRPIVYIKPGESIIVEVEDACSGQIMSEEDFRDTSKIPFGNPVVGPIYVEDAKPGDSLAVSIEEINPIRGKAVTYFSDFSEFYLASSPIFRFIDVSLPRKPKICPIENGLIHFSDRVSIPYQPMVGTVGTAPLLEVESASSSLLPGRHGGNMDLPEIGPGATVFLPVFHEGGLLYVGDVHAAQGDGEISGTGMEIAAEVKTKIGLVKGEMPRWPRVENRSEIMYVTTTSNGLSLEDV